jgi:hypothetical protein
MHLKGRRERSRGIAVKKGEGKTTKSLEYSILGTQWGLQWFFTVSSRFELQCSTFQFSESHQKFTGKSFSIASVKIRRIYE